MNAYQVFGVPEKPLVDLEELKQKLHDFSKVHHSSQDELQDQQWHDINQAYQLLINDVKRIKHLLESNGDEDPNASTAVPAAVMDLFSRVGPKLHRANEVIQEMDSAASALEKAMLQEDVMSLSIDLQQIAAEVGEYRSQLMAQIAELDTVWQQQTAIDVLAELYQQLIYVARWAKQLDEKLFRLMNF